MTTGSSIEKLKETTGRECSESHRQILQKFAFSKENIPIEITAGIICSDNVYKYIQ